MAENGWIKLHRKIREHWLYQEQPYSKFQAWVDILLEVNHSDGKIFFDGQLIHVKRGQMITSEIKLADKWGWSRKKVRNFLQLLEQDSMIRKTAIPNKYTIIEVINYDLYQKEVNDNDSQQEKTSPKSLQKDTGQDTTKSLDTNGVEEFEEQQKELLGNNSGTTEEQLRNTNKNDKKNKEEKRNYIKINTLGEKFSAKTSSTSMADAQKLLSRYTHEQQELIIQYWNTVRFTRKSGKIADSVKLREMEYWAKYPVDVVIEALKIHIAKYQTKTEDYTRGIIRRLAREKEMGGGHNATPKRTNSEEKLSSLMQEAYRPAFDYKVDLDKLEEILAGGG